MMTRLTLRARLACAAVVGVNWLSRVSGRGGGTVAGGRVGLLLCRDLLGQLTTGRTVVAVSGTNGKTTTTAMIAAGWGSGVATNSSGANMLAGHVVALVGSTNTRVVLEVDEGWLPDFIRDAHFQVLVLLNLSRDQLDRASEVRQLAERWRRRLEESGDPELVVVANANDPLVVYAALGARHLRWCDVPTPWLDDARSCPVCTRALVHERGDWHCICGFAKPIDVSTTLGEELVVGQSSMRLQLSIPGDFNRVNAAMAVTALVEVGVAPEESIGPITALVDVGGRFTLRRWSGHVVRLALAKNPAGFSAILSTVEPTPHDVWIAINAKIADGRDPSWLYDVPFEQLRGHRVICLGDRRVDLATRLEYAGVEFLVADDDSSIPPSLQPVGLIANYTAFSEWLAKSAPC
jgi:UDP-N-acetylmuramyl tripeptide synthase